MKVGVLATMIFGALIGFPIASFAGLAPDADGDGVPDVLDNCSAVANAGTLDCDTDQDGYGNRCDCDLNQSAAATAADLNWLWKAAFKRVAPDQPQSRITTAARGLSGADLNIWKTLFKNAATQFKSGLSCAKPASADGCPN